MKKLFIILLTISSSIIILSCSKNDDDKKPSLIQKSQLIGKWQTFKQTNLETGEVSNWEVIEWGQMYVGTFELGDNGLFYNSSERINPADGRWEFDNRTSKLTFYISYPAANGPMDHLIQEFNVEINSSNNLILKDNHQKIEHLKVN